MFYFSKDLNATNCIQHTYKECPKNHYVISSVYADRYCEPCQTGRYSNEPTDTYCKDFDSCGNGTSIEFLWKRDLTECEYLQETSGEFCMDDDELFENETNIETFELFDMNMTDFNLTDFNMTDFNLTDFNMTDFNMTDLNPLEESSVRNRTNISTSSYFILECLNIQE